MRTWINPIQNWLWEEAHEEKNRNHWRDRNLFAQVEISEVLIARCGWAMK
jgi:hypothetical protein